MRTASAGSGQASTETAAADGATAGPAHHPEIDWSRAVSTPEFRELVRKRWGFVIPATAFFMAWYFGFIVLSGYAPDFMGERIYEGLTVGYVLALTQFLMVWGLTALYLRRADRVFDPLAERARQRALEISAAPGDGAPRTRRFDPAETERAATPAEAGTRREVTR